MIEEEHLLPPKRQDIFTILNFHKLRYPLQNYYVLVKLCGNIQIHDNNEKAVGLESWCNQQEFLRVSLFQTMVRIKYFYGNDMSLPKFHTYDRFCTEYLQVTPECVFPSVSSIDGDKITQKCDVTATKPTLIDVCSALHIIAVWIYNFVMILIGKLGFLFLGFVWVLALIVIASLGIAVCAGFIGLYTCLFIALEWPGRIIFVLLTTLVTYYRYVRK